MQPLERDRPLKACPNLSCRRLKTCHRQAENSTCLKTHFRSVDEFYEYLTAKINRINQRYGVAPEDEDQASDDEALSAMSKIFQARERELEAMGASAKSKL